MNKYILNTVNQEYINKNLDSDTTSLLFKKNETISVEIKKLIEQIEAKKRCQKKLPTWFNSDNIYYPNKLNIEQTSSEITAEYKSSLISGNSIIDLTGGFGVDCYYFAKQFKNVTHCEINEDLSEIVKHNYQQLKIDNIHCLNTDGIAHLKQSEETFDWIYIDPSRRHDSKGKVFFLNDCLPNVPEYLELLFNHSKRILIKTSPLLDFSIGINELKNVKTIHVVAVNNEVKELLWILEKDYDKGINIATINLKSNKTEEFEFPLNKESEAEVSYSEPLNYMYEPNSAILKSGAFKSIASQLNVYKLHVNSHLYTYNKLIKFPGRRFKIDKVLPYNKKLLKKEFMYIKANISIRNFPETVNQIRSKFSIKDGGDMYLFFTTNCNNEKIILVCSKAD